MIRKEISILISAVFIITLISSTPVQSVRVSGAENQDFLYSLSVSPTFVRVQQGEFGTFEVKVQRGSDAGQFFVDLSLTADSSLPRGAVTFNPPTLSFEQGQSAANSTMKINSHGLDPGSFRFRVGAATHTPVGSDQAVSNPAALIVSPRSNSLTASESTGASGAQTEENNRVLQETTPTPIPTPTQPNRAPIANAGEDQVINEGQRGILDGSASTDPDKDALSFSWEQLVPRQPTIKLASSEGSGKASFIAPDVDRDTVFRFNLIVQDGNGGQATDLVNILVKNAVAKESPASTGPRAEQEEQQQQNQAPTSQAGETSSASTENHSPVAGALQTILVSDGTPLSFSLEGNDPDNGDTISFVIVSAPSRGTLAGFDKATGKLTYVPTSVFTGQDRLSFKVVDSSGAESNLGLVIMKGSTAVGSTSSPSSSSPSLSPAKANENSTKSTGPANNGSSAVSTSPSTTESVQLSTGNKSSAIKPGDNQSAAAGPAANQTGENQTLASFAASALSVGEQYFFHLNWGKFGTQNGNFSNPHDIAIDKDGNVFVLDSGNNRVQKFDKSGNFIPTSFPTTFSSPQGIAVDNGQGQGNGEVYVVDSGNNLVKRFSNTGVLIKSWGGPSGSGPLNTPVDAVIDSSHNVYVSDANNHRIVKTDNNGGFILKFGATGNAQGKVQGPHAMAVDSKDFIYVVDSSNNKRVVKYTKDGVWSGTNIVGCESGTFSMPHGIAIDSGDKVFVTDRAGNNVCKFNDQGGFIASFGNPLPDTATNFNGPDGIATMPASGDPILQVYVVDTGNNRVEVFSNVAPPSITISLDNTSPKWGFAVTATVDVTGAQQSDKISISWGDGSPDTVITPISVDAQGNAQVTTTHIYAASAISTNPNKVAGELLTSQGAQKAKTPTPDIEVTVQKHVTSLSLALRPADSDFGVDSAFTILGRLVDNDANGAQIGGKTISFSGSGVTPQSINPVQTGGVTATAPQGKNVEITSSELILPVGSHISLPDSSFGISYKFTGASTGSNVGLTLTKPDNSVKSPIAIVNGLQQYPFAVKDIAIRNVSGSTGSSEFAKLQILKVINSAVEPPEQLEIDFTDSAGVGQVAGLYSSVAISRGSYLSTGVSPPDKTDGLKITGTFDGTGDAAYLGATSLEVSYNADPAQGKGTGTTTANSAGAGDFVWTALSVGNGGASDVCTQNGATSATGDVDKDGICDKWESASGGNGNTDVTPAHRYIVCPSSSGFVAIDTDCASNPTVGQPPIIKYDLCFADEFADVWNFEATPDKISGTRICPTVGHKDIYVEIDSMSGREASAEAIRNVIKAFGNGPITGQTADAFGHTSGITLHVVKDEEGLSALTPLVAWRDPLTVAQPSPVDSFQEVKNQRFGTGGTGGERAGNFMTPVQTSTQWNSHGKVLKHYVYHYGIWAIYYAKDLLINPTCPAAGLSSGVAEILGNDFIVSLGCGFKASGDAGSPAEQAGTFMHELGHNLNLAHGGSITGHAPLDTNMNCKPNYFSVMSYSRQLPIDNVFPRTNWESGFNYGPSGFQTALDYSRATAPKTASPTLLPGQIFEGTTTPPAPPALPSPDENVGMESSTTGQYYFLYRKTSDGSTYLGQTGKPFDFSGSPGMPIPPAPTGDLNSIATVGCAATAGQKLSGFADDWANLNLVFLTTTDQDSQDGTNDAKSIPQASQPTIELDPPFVKSVRDNAADPIEFIPPPATDGSSVSNAGSNVPMKFRVKDIDGNFVRDWVVTMVAKKGATTIVGPTTFVYDLPTEKYQFNWISPSGGPAKGVWQISYFRDYLTPTQTLLRGPEAEAIQAPYTYTLTLK